MSLVQVARDLLAVHLVHDVFAVPRIRVGHVIVSQLGEAGLVFDDADDVGDRVVVVQQDAHLAVFQVEHTPHEVGARGHDFARLAEPIGLLLQLTTDQADFAAGEFGERIGADDFDRLVVGKETGQRRLGFFGLLGELVGVFLASSAACCFFQALTTSSFTSASVGTRPGVSLIFMTMKRLPSMSTVFTG